MALTKVIGAGLGTVTDNADFDGTLNVQGETTLQTHLNLGDNDIIKVGAGSDIQIYHDGSYSRIMESGGTALVLDTTSTDIRLTASNSEVMGKFIKDGAVQLYYDNSQKLSTTSSGVTITGAIRVGADNAANELDDYEEGTWTPALTGLTLSTALGNYTKIGRLVTVEISIGSLVRTDSGSNGILLISLPIASGAATSGGGSVAVHAITWAGAAPMPMRFAADTIGFLANNHAGGSWSWETSAVLNPTTNEFRIIFTYNVS